MKPRIAKKIIQGRSNIGMTYKRAVAIRAALVGTKFNRKTKTVLFGYLYGCSPAILQAIITKGKP